MSRRSVHWTARCRGAVCFWLRPILTSKTGGMDASPETVHTRAHLCPALEHIQSAGQHPASRQATAPWPILHCAFCANSVGDLCIVVQLVPVPGPPALSIMACCSGDSSACNLAAWTASAADRILDCSSKAMSRARLLGGTRSFVCTGAGRTISAVRLSATHGLISYSLLASFSTATLACSSTATLERSRSTFAASAFSTSGCGSRIGLFNASQIPRHNSTVQVHSRPVRRLCCETHLSNSKTQTSITDREFRTFPRSLRNFTTKEPLTSFASALPPVGFAAEPSLPVGRA